MYLKQNFYTNLEVETFGIFGLYLNKLEITCNIKMDKVNLNEESKSKRV